MTSLLRPEVLSAEQRDERAAQLQQNIGREWLRFAITFALVVWPPFLVLLVAFLKTDAVPESALVLTMIVVGHVGVALVVYWLTRRIHPLQKELESLRRYVAVE